jgi:hypothetical protein
VPARILNEHQLDCLLVEGWEPTVWKLWVERADKANRPKIILSSTSVGELENEEGVFRKSTRKAIENLGYHTTYWLLEDWKYGAALDQTCLAVVHFLEQTDGKMPERPRPADLPVRPMSNLVMPVGIPYKARCRTEPKAWKEQGAAQYPCKVERRVGSGLIFEEEGAMPEDIASWIGTR